MTLKPFLSYLGGACASLGLLSGAARGQLFDNLAKLSPTIPVGSGALKDPVVDEQGNVQDATDRADGPKWVVTGDFDGDGNVDFATCHNNGELTTVYGKGDGTFEKPINFQSGTGALRSLTSADFNGDGLDDIAAADPYGGVVAVLLGHESRQMVALEQVTTFRFGRNIASGDFDGDGVPDLVVAGSDDPDLGQPITGAVYARGLGDGTFERKGNTPEVGLYREDGKIKPVFSLEPFRRVGDTKDSVAVTWEGASIVRF